MKLAIILDVPVIAVVIFIATACRKRGPEADAAAAVCNLGLENWPPHWLPEKARHGSSAVDAGTALPEDFLVGHDLVGLAKVYGVTMWKGDRMNKGWAGHTIERHLGLALNSSRSPNFGSWELKVVPVRALPDGALKVKETMAITMIDPVEVAAKEFPSRKY
jgi:hypothetical protein